MSISTVSSRGCHARQTVRQRAKTGPNLDEDVHIAGTSGPDNPVDYSAVNEKVLPKCLGWGNSSLAELARTVIALGAAAAGAIRVRGYKRLPIQ